MSSVNCSVLSGFEFVFDEDGKVWITLERLNLLGNPVVTVNLEGKVNSDGDDVANSSIKATMLTDALADSLVTASITVASESSNDVDVSVQFKDAQGNNLEAICGIDLWLQTSASGYVPGALPSGGAPVIVTSQGSIIRAMTAAESGSYLSNSSGLLVLRFTEAGALTRYISGLVGSKLVTGDAGLIWTA